MSTEARPSPLEPNARTDLPKRRMTRSDLVMPRGPYSMKTARLTLAGGVGMAILYVFFPLLMVSIFVDLGQWLFAAVGIAAVFFWVALFVTAVREHADDQRYLRTF